MEGSREPPLAQTRQAVQEKAGTGWSAPARVAMCEVLHAKLPQQERLPELWKGERVAEGLACRREWSDCALAPPERWYREGTGPCACADSATADAGKGAGAQRRMHPLFGRQR